MQLREEGLAVILPHAKQEQKSWTKINMEQTPLKYVKKSKNEKRWCETYVPSTTFSDPIQDEI